jgi:hypothetical protein
MMDRKHKDARNELFVCQRLLENGYEVFRNISQHGPADLIAWNPDTSESLKIDVKTFNQPVLKGIEYLYARNSARLKSSWESS